MKTTYEEKPKAKKDNASPGGHTPPSQEEWGKMLVGEDRSRELLHLACIRSIANLVIVGNPTDAVTDERAEEIATICREEFDKFLGVIFDRLHKNCQCYRCERIKS
jgi:hypothetical protein